MSSLSEKRSKILNFKGAITATCTPYDQKGAINPSMVSSYASHLLKIGVTGVYVHGSTGEGLSLTKDEKLVLTKKWFDVLRGGNTLTIMNVSSTCYLESIELAKNFEQIGVDAIAILPPIYYRPRNVSDLVKYLKLIADAAPNTPLVYYHIPILTYVNLDLNEFIELALKEIPTFTAMKYTCDDYISVQRVQYEFKDRFKICMGFEQMLLPGLMCDIDAGVASFFNLGSCVKAYNSMCQVYKQNIDAAKENQRVITDKIKELSVGGKVYTSVRKAIYNETGGTVDLGNPRPPVDM